MKGQGFVALPNVIVRDKELTVNAKMAYAILLSWSWTDPKDWPEQKELAEEMNVSANTWRQAVRTLCEAGMVEVIRRGQGRTNIYRPLLKATQKPQIAASRNAKSAELDAQISGIPSIEQDKDQDQGQDKDRTASFPAEASSLAEKYLGRLREESPKTFAPVSATELLEIATDEGFEPITAARMLGDVAEWWRNAPPSKRWKRPARGWRNWCRREQTAPLPETNGHLSAAQPAVFQGVCESCARVMGHDDDCPKVVMTV